MNRISFGVGSIWAVSAGALLALACNGQISAGSNTPKLETVSSADVSGPVTACQPGYAHPNVCCNAANCGTYPSAPFHACDSTSGYLTYPDPRSCCELDASGNCTAPPAVPPPTSGLCAYACPPGQFQPPAGVNVAVGTSVGSGSGVEVGPTCTGTAGGSGSGSGLESCGGYTGSGSGTDYGSGSGSSYTGSGSGTDYGSGSGSSYTGSGSGTDYGSGSGAGYTGSGTGSYYGSGSGSSYPPYVGTTCCTGDPNGSLACSALATPPSLGCACVCPANGPCPPCNCPAEPVPPPPLTGCNACPQGWQTPTGATPDLCCQQDPNTGDIDCFSQAVAPPGGFGSSNGSGSGSSSGGVTVAADDGGPAMTACFPEPCPSNAMWNPVTCSCQ